MIAFSQLLEAGVAGLVDAITSLENELRETRHTVVSLQERIRILEETVEADGIDVELIDKILDNYDLEAKIETIVDDRIDSALDMRLDDAIESALSGREIEVTLSGSATL